MYLYIVTRNDLAPGAQLAQTAHAAFQFSQENPEQTKTWYNESNYICILAVDSERELQDLAMIDAKMSIVQEPDFDNATTAIAFEATPEVRKALAGLKLAGATAPYQSG